MTREEACLIGYHIIQMSAKAKDQLFAALEAYGSGNYANAKKLIDKANILISQTINEHDSCYGEAQQDKETSLIIKHGRSALQATEIFRDYVLDLTRIPSRKAALPAVYHYYA